MKHTAASTTQWLSICAALPKAMVVSINKATALKMYDKVRYHWTEETARVEKEIAELTKTPARERAPSAARKEAVFQKELELAATNAEKICELQVRLAVLKTTDMALIVSAAQNEVEQMQKLGLDIVPHRKRINESEPPLDEKFKDTADPLRLVFVCAMWLTGSDAPSCSTVYLDKPMRNHTLMQTIARVNRVFPGKHSGLIVDYANVFLSLEKALAIYGAGKAGNNPVKDKAKLVEEMRQAVEAATAFCAGHKVVLAEIEALPAGNMQRLQAIADAMDALISPDPLRRDFFTHERLVMTLFKAVKPDPAALEFAGRVSCIVAIADAIRAKLHPGPVDVSRVMSVKVAIEDVLHTGLPTKYSKDLYNAKCAAVFEHFYEGYPDRGKGVYAEAG